MSVFVALLRGVNVGQAKRVAMADWRRLLGDLGFDDVSTLLNSGNAVFRAGQGQSQQHAAAIQAALASRLGLDVSVTVLARSRLKAVVKQCVVVLPEADHTRLLAIFVQDRVDLGALAAIAPLALPPDQFVMGEQAAYLYCAAGILQSRAGKALLGKAGASATTRNWATVLKLHAMAQAL